MAVKTRLQLKAENTSDFPDNTLQLISAADLRGQMDDTADSVLMPEDVPGLDISQAIVTSSGDLTQSLETWMNDVTPGAGGGVTVDTGEAYKIIMLSNGTVRAVPADADPPLTPTNIDITVRLTNVTLAWDMMSGATSYQVKRNGVNYATTAFTTYRDSAVTIGQTYSYTVSSIDTYQQYSPASPAVDAFIDPALNQAPADVAITVWPTPIPTDGYSYVRVNARELDVQLIAYELECDVGSLEPTVDPSTWIIRI